MLLIQLLLHLGHHVLDDLEDGLLGLLALPPLLLYRVQALRRLLVDLHEQGVVPLHSFRLLIFYLVLQTRHVLFQVLSHCLDALVPFFAFLLYPIFQCLVLIFDQLNHLLLLLYSRLPLRLESLFNRFLQNFYRLQLPFMLIMMLLLIILNKTHDLLQVRLVAIKPLLVRVLPLAQQLGRALDLAIYLH